MRRTLLQEEWVVWDHSLRGQCGGGFLMRYLWIDDSYELVENLRLFLGHPEELRDLHLFNVVHRGGEPVRVLFGILALNGWQDNHTLWHLKLQELLTPLEEFLTVLPLAFQVVSGDQSISLNILEFLDLLGDKAIFNQRVQGAVWLLLQLTLCGWLCTKDRHHHSLPLLVEHLLQLFDPDMIQVALFLPRSGHRIDNYAYALNFLGQVHDGRVIDQKLEHGRLPTLLHVLGLLHA